MIYDKMYLRKNSYRSKFFESDENQRVLIIDASI